MAVSLKRKERDTMDARMEERHGTPAQGFQETAPKETEASPETPLLLRLRDFLRRRLPTTP